MGKARFEPVLIQNMHMGVLAHINVYAYLGLEILQSKRLEKIIGPGTNLHLVYTRTYYTSPHKLHSH